MLSFSVDQTEIDKPSNSTLQWRPLLRTTMNILRIAIESPVLLKNPIRPFQLFFFQTFEDFGIIRMRESSYFSHNPWQISQLKNVPFGRH